MTTTLSRNVGHREHSDARLSNGPSLENSMTRFIVRFALHVLLLLAATVASAGDFFEKDGVALRSYDPVSYFTEGKPQQGLPTHSYVHKGSKFYFASADNRHLFAENPDGYAPQFGGYCAYGTAQGYKVSTQPDAFAVVDGKLYLNYNREVLQIWRQDVPGNIARAEENWPEVSKMKLMD
jgi:YHS domain-containing protein